jgi:hypothetical protein
MDPRASRRWLILQNEDRGRLRFVSSLVTLGSVSNPKNSGLPKFWLTRQSKLAKNVYQTTPTDIKLHRLDSSSRSHCRQCKSPRTPSFVAAGIVPRYSRMFIETPKRRTLFTMVSWGRSLIPVWTAIAVAHRLWLWRTSACDPNLKISKRLTAVLCLVFKLSLSLE